MTFNLVEPETLLLDLYRGLADGRVLLMGAEGEKANPMTVAWGHLGLVWGLPSFVAWVRPSRHTYGFIERAGHFSVNVLPPEAQRIAAFCGSQSGRDVDKIKELDLHLETPEGAAQPLLAEAVCGLVCQVVHFSDVIPENLDAACQKSFYSGGDYHRQFVGRILGAWHKTPL